jgi:3-methylcrotonyl-CoA carboxylase alpha subunit
MAEAAVALTARQCYSGAGTVEFIVDAETNQFYFLEKNTRIQVEHPVTEMITDVDLVALQLRFAAGDDLSDVVSPGAEPVRHAIECRLCAENPDRMFLPSPGTLTRLVFPLEDAHVRVDTGVRQGDKVTPWYDPMIAKIIVSGENRAQSLDRMANVLEATRVEGIVSNLAFLLRVIRHPAFRAGESFTGFVEAHRNDLLSSS